MIAAAKSEASAAHGGTPSTAQGAATLQPARPGKLLRLPPVEDMTGLKKSTIYAAVRAHTFPAPVRVGARAVAWREQDVLDWCASRVSTVAGVSA